MGVTLFSPTSSELQPVQWLRTGFHTPKLTVSSISHQCDAQKIEPNMSTVSHKKDNDVISRLIEKDLRIILENIFLQLDCQDLKMCKRVCKSWNDFLKTLFWKNNAVLNILRRRLKENWEQEKFKRVQVVVEGFACRENCNLNYRLCDCQLMCQEVTGSRLVILLNSKKIDITYAVNNGDHFKITKLFDRPQYQLQLLMNSNLMPDEKVFLARPIFFKNNPNSRRKVKVKTNILVEIDEEEKSFLKVSCIESDKIISRFKPYTGEFRLKGIQLCSTLFQAGARPPSSRAFPRAAADLPSSPLAACSCTGDIYHR